MDGKAENGDGGLEQPLLTEIERLSDAEPERGGRGGEEKVGRDDGKYRTNGKHGSSEVGCCDPERCDEAGERCDEAGEVGVHAAYGPHRSSDSECRDPERCDEAGEIGEGDMIRKPTPYRTLAIVAFAIFASFEVLQGWGMRVLAELWNGTDYTFVPSNAQRVQRWMGDEGIRDTRAPAGGQRQRMDNGKRGEIQDALDEEEGREGGAREGGVADEAVGEPDLPGEEVVMTSRGVGRAGPAPRAPRSELEHARREKRVVGGADVEVRDTGREKRARQTTIDEMYDKERLAEFTDAWLQWIYVKGLPFNAFRGPEFQRVRQATERVPRTIQFRFPSYRVTAGAGIPSQRAKVATMVSEVRASFRHTGATILSDGRKSRSGKPLVNFLAGGANGALLYATVARDGSVRDTADIVYRRWRAIILSFPAKDVIDFCTDSSSNYTAAARRFATDPEPDIRRITWLPCSTHVCNLILSDIGT
ncbi:hypothetical protein CBR_g19432 [Chara braunii]|uniref:DUF659 domain-containing protein n=1 Tax=Chara braunii TaxID=69332 RepID=A0A388KY20_CHABU|nr:hypothetical protein CBR_g19432 [Chara braunii]|eukprot:GBG74918.1 hypothetical protein CBR_g19432 [Chara braunii]